MDILELYSENNKSFDFSQFVESQKKDIVLHCSTLDIQDGEWSKLKTERVTLLKEFQENHSDVKITSDLFRVNWSDLMQKRRVVISNRAAKRAMTDDVVNHNNSMIQIVENQNSRFFEQESEPCLGNLMYKEAITKARILDFAQKKDKSTLEKCLSSQTYKVFKNQYNTKLNRDAELGNYCKQVINTDHLSLKTIHKEKKRVRHGKADQLWVLKVVKLYLTMSKYDFLNEDVYLYFVIARILIPSVRMSDQMQLLLGESHLKAKAVEINSHLYDGERRYAGPKIDGILIDKKYNLEVALLEVSGPLSKVNQTHFLEDRNKIAKNLKAMYKYIASKMEVPSLTLLKELKWFGLQVYDNKMHVYSLSKPCEHSYVFSQDVCFPVLDNKSILSHSLPTFIKNITVINDIIKTTRDILDKLFTVDDEQEVLNEYQQVVSPHQSPHKKQKLDD